jgi:hypothetical protein
MVVTWIPSHIGIRVIAIMSMYKDVLIDYVEVTDILQSFYNIKSLWKVFC